MNDNEKMDFKQRVGARIHVLRDGKGWTQEELGKALSFNKNAVGAWERGEKSPNIQTIAQIAELFETSTDFLLTGRKLSDASVGEKTGLSQRAIDDLEVWNSGKFTVGFADFILTQRAYESHYERVGFNDLIGAVSQAVRLKVADIEEAAEETNKAAPSAPSGLYIGDGESIPYSILAEGLCVRAGDILMSLISEYVREEARKHAKKEDNP